MSINLLISSKQRENADQSASKYRVILPDIIKCNEDEYFTMTVSSFSMIRSFYNIQNDYNNHFRLIHRTYIYDFYITEGNYDVYSLADVLEQGYSFLKVSYDEITNKFTFSVNNENLPEQSNPPDETDLNVDDPNATYLQCMNSEQVFGLDNLVKYDISSSSKTSVRPVNVSAISNILIKAKDMDIVNTVSNNQIQQWNNEQIILNLNIQDTPPMGSINYVNQDILNQHCYKIGSNQIIGFQLEIVDLDAKVIIGMSDYLLNLIFTKHKIADTNLIFRSLTRIEDYIRTIHMLILSYLDRINFFR